MFQNQHAFGEVRDADLDLIEGGQPASSHDLAMGVVVVGLLIGGPCGFGFAVGGLIAYGIYG